MAEEKGKPLTREDVCREIDKCRSKGEVPNFLNKVFEEGIDLGKLDLAGANLRSAHLERANLYHTYLEGANLYDTHLERADLCDTHLEGANLIGTHLEGANLINTKFSSDVSLEEVDWGNYILDEENRGSFDSAVASYRHLKMWYTQAGYTGIAAKFYYREMEAKRKAQSWKKQPHLKLWSWIMRLLCGYGERYGNVVVAALVIIFGLAVVYGFGGLNLAYAIYFSAVSFTALGYGSWLEITDDWIRGIGAFESFIGVFTIALFLVTFTIKMTR